MPTKWNQALDKVFEFSLYLLILGIPFSKSVVQVAIYLIILTWLTKRILKRDLSPPTMPFLKPWLFFLFLCLISFFGAEYLQLSVRAFFTKYLKYLLMTIAIVELVSERRIFKNIVWVSAITLFVVIANGVLQYITGFDITGNKVQIVNIANQDFRRLNGSFSHPNDYGTYLIAMIPLVLSFSLISLKKMKTTITTFVLLAGTILSLYLTQSRGAIAAFVGATATILFLWKKKWGAVFIAGVLLFVFVAPLPLAKNIRNTFNFQSASSGSLKDRIYLWESTIEMIKVRPFFGWGLNNYARVHPRFVDKDSWYTHNCYLQMASEIGILGLLSFLVLLGFIFCFFYKASFQNHSSKKENRILLGGFFTSFLAIAFHAGVDTNFYSPPLTALFWLVIAIGLTQFQKKSEGLPKAQ